MSSGCDGSGHSSRPLGCDKRPHRLMKSLSLIRNVRGVVTGAPGLSDAAPTDSPGGRARGTQSPPDPKEQPPPRQPQGKARPPAVDTGVGRGWGAGSGGTHRVPRLGHPDHEDQLGAEQRAREVPVGAVQVGAQRPHQGQERGGGQQCGQGHGHGGVGDGLQGQDLSVLRAAGKDEGR